ncbi:hypothetical protein PspLS_01099 [Pyricularia sp. CBS 133598]|nr:hypothetical protein PspLS_01099 [Pyricularia sp. CBS 133598]
MVSPPSLPLPPFAPFLSAELRDQIQPDEWTACITAWVSLIEAHLSLSEDDFLQHSLVDESIPEFLVSFSHEVATHGSTILGPAAGQQPLLKGVFMLTNRLLVAKPESKSKQKIIPPTVLRLLQWEFFADLCRTQSRKRIPEIFSALPAERKTVLETSLAALKKSLIHDLDAGLANPAALRELEARLDRLNFLIARIPWAAAFFLAGSDFLDGLVTCFRIMNPPLRKVIVATAYLCVMGLAEASGGGYGVLTDQLYALRAAAEAHRAGPLNVNDSLVAELVTSTPLLGQLERRVNGASESASTRVKLILKDLAGFKKPGVGLRQPARRLQKKVDKGKGVALDLGVPSQEMHIHRMEQITQIQDLFPELGSGFVAKLLVEYGEDQEQVVAHLLDDSLPEHLKVADRSEELSSNTGHRTPPLTDHMAPRSTPPRFKEQSLPVRHNVFDDDEIDMLSGNAGKLHLGKHNPGRTADDILKDKSKAPDKATILAALATFDSDDDERDDTYDVEDVGGTVDAAGEAEDQTLNDEVLFKAWKAEASVFGRDNATRNSAARQGLRAETGLTDEAIEGWAIMLSRNPQQQRRLEAKFTMFTGAQTELASTAWRASPGGSGAEDSDAGGSAGRGRGRGRGRGGRGSGRGRGGGPSSGGDASGPTGDAGTEQARRRKEANKSSRANHNRRAQRARKMGGMPG